MKGKGVLNNKREKNKEKEMRKFVAVVFSTMLWAGLLQGCSPQQRFSMRYESDVKTVPLVTSVERYPVGKDIVFGDPSCSDSERFFIVQLDVPMVFAIEANNLIRDYMAKHYEQGGIGMFPVDLQPQERSVMRHLMRFRVLGVNDCEGARNAAEKMSVDEVNKTVEEQSHQRLLRIPPIPTPPKVQIIQ